MRDWLTLSRKTLRVLVNSLRLARAQSRFQQLFLLASGLGLLLGLGRLFYDGFRFLGALGGLGVMLLQHLFSLFFCGLGLLLALSSFITAYTVLFQSDEIRFLWPRPVATGALLLHKWMETTWLSAWAFFCIILPFMGAFAWYEKLSPWFILWTFVFTIPFVFLYAGLGLTLALLAFRWLPQWRLRAWGLLLLAGILLVRLLTRAPQSTGAADDTVFLLARLTPGLKLASHPLWPSRWVADGITAWARGHWARGGLLLSLLLAQVLALGALLEAWGGRLFRAAWLRLNDAPPRRIRRAARRLSLAAGLTVWLAPDTRALWLKDWRLLWRDPAQALQSLFFFGILAFYFFNLRNLNYHLLSDVWRNLIVFLNMFSLAAVMCSLCSRFIYPQMSLEGQSFWILGLAPTTAWRILRAKFLGALAILLVISIGLMSVSTALLNVSAHTRNAALLMSAALPFGLCALACGLGTLFMDLQQRNPVAILSGFGGTLSLALSLAFMMAAILPFGIVRHAALIGRLSERGQSLGTVMAVVWLFLLTATTTALPLLAGRRSLVTREF